MVQIIKSGRTKRQTKGKFSYKKGEDQVWSYVKAKRREEEEEKEEQEKQRYGF